MQYYQELARPKKIAIFGGGLSLTDIDLSILNKNGFIIGINDYWRSGNSVDVVFTIDTSRLDLRFSDCPFKKVVAIPPRFGEKSAKAVCDRTLPTTQFEYMYRGQNVGLAENPISVHGGENSAYGALNYAYHMYPKYIFMFGIDMVNMGTYHHEHKDIRPQKQDVNDRVPDNFRTTVNQLNNRGISVVNCSMISKVDCFHQISPEEGIALWNTI